MRILSMVRRMIRSVATRGRLLAVGLLALLALVVGAIVRSADTDAELDVAAFLSDFGLTLFVPVVVLVITTATLGTLVEEKTLVYLWLRPIGRWQIAAAAFAAGLIVLIPLVLAPMAALGGIVGDGGDAWGIVLASAVGLAGYAGVFTLLGLLTQRALVWGLVYILVWEGFIAGLSRTAGWFAIRTYTRSALSRAADAPGLIDSPVTGSSTAMIVVAVLAVSGLLTTWRLSTMDVD